MAMTTRLPIAGFLLAFVATGSIAATNVSGTITTQTWTKANGPYRVTGAITVPAGNTLTIQAGVDVLFDANVQFAVQGKLQAIGTAMDSIRFVKGTAAEWGGIRISGSDSSTIAYARIGGGHANGAPGGGILAHGSEVRVKLSHCVVEKNVADVVGGGVCVEFSKVWMDYCLIRKNTANTPGQPGGGGIYASDGAFVGITNSTITGNIAVERSGVYCSSGSIALRSSIVWLNTPIQAADNYGSVTAAYCDVELPSSSFPGTGNINADPKFVNATAGDYGLRYGSPCIDVGDSVSPPDPDGTRADMGAFPFANTDAPFSEDFEDGVVDSRVSISVTGTFPTQPGIKSATDFGSTKAFGFGRSSCGASCFENYRARFVITFPDTQYIWAIRFKEMEKYGNWGSAGRVLANGVTLPGLVFGREPYGDRIADVSFRERGFIIGRTVTSLTLEVYDVTNVSEIFIDDIIIDRTRPAGTLVSGTITTQTWTKANSPYHVTGAITVPAGNTLTIQPGVDVLYDNDVQIVVQGRLKAVGMAADSIRFLPGIAATHHGLSFSGGDTSTIEYGRISGSGGTGIGLDGAGTRLGLSNSVVSGNRSNSNGGGVWIGGGARLSGSSCLIRGNSAGDSGGAIYSQGITSKIRLNDYFFAENTAWAQGSGICSINGLVSLIGCSFMGNQAGASGGGVYSSYGPVSLISCSFTGNRAGYSGGAVYSNGATTLVDCQIARNHSGTNGGGLYIESGGVTISYSLIAMNDASDTGGGLYATGPVALRNVTFADNSAANGAGGTRFESATNSFTNCVFRGNSPNDFPISTVIGPSMVYSIRGIAWGGVGNITGDPLFVDPDNGDYHLQRGSPCIDTGDPASPLDPDGTRADMGAFYYHHLFNYAPAWAPRADIDATENVPVSFTVSATDPDGDSLTYAAPAIPAGATFTPSTRTFSWTPPYSWAPWTDTSRVFDAVFTVADSEYTVRDTVTITVANVNRAPTWTRHPDRTGAEASPLSFTLDAVVDPDGAPIRYSMPTIPAGATFDPVTRVFSWTPTYRQAGIHMAIFAARDTFVVKERIYTVRDTVWLTIANTPLPPFTLIPVGDSVVIGRTVTLTVRASDPALDSLDFTADPRPHGSTFNPKTHVFTWTRCASQSADTVVRFNASDTEKTVSRTVPLRAGTANRLPTVTWEGTIPDTVSWDTDLSVSVADLDYDMAGLLFQVSTNSGATWTTMSLIGDTARAPTPRSVTVTWRTFEQFPGRCLSAVRIRCAAKDTEAGSRSERTVRVLNLRADFNRDGMIGLADFDILRSAFAARDTTRNLGPYRLATGDAAPNFSVTQDRKIDFDDMMGFVAQWDWACTRGRVERIARPATRPVDALTAQLLRVRAAEGNPSVVEILGPDDMASNVLGFAIRMPVGTLAKSTLSRGEWTGADGWWLCRTDSAAGVVEVWAARTPGASLSPVLARLILPAGLETATMDVYWQVPRGTDDADAAGAYAIDLRVVPLPAAWAMTVAPNPFNPATTIRYDVPSRAHVRLVVADVLGRRVATLVDEPREMGRHVVQWNGTDGAGRAVASGVYIVRLEAGETRIVSRVAFVR